MHCGIPFLCLGGSTFTIVFSNFSISYMSLLLFLLVVLLCFYFVVVLVNVVN